MKLTGCTLHQRGSQDGRLTQSSQRLQRRPVSARRKLSRSWCFCEGQNLSQPPTAWFYTWISETEDLGPTGCSHLLCSDRKDRSHAKSGARTPRYLGGTVTGARVAVRHGSSCFACCLHRGLTSGFAQEALLPAACTASLFFNVVELLLLYYVIELYIN